MNQQIHALIFLLFSLVFISTAHAEPVKIIQVDIEVDGLDGDLLSNALNFMDINQRRNDKDLSAVIVLEMHKLAPKQISKSLKAYGYFHPSIKSDIKVIGDDYLAKYTIDLGKSIRLKTIDIKWLGAGANDKILQQQMSVFPAKEGDILDQQAYDKAKTDLLEKANEIGYPKAKSVEHRIEVDPADYSAIIYLHLDTGPLIYYGKITVQQDFLKPELIEGYIDIQSGQLFTPSSLLATQESISKSNYLVLLILNQSLRK